MCTWTAGIVVCCALPVWVGELETERESQSVSQSVSCLTDWYVWSPFISEWSCGIWGVLTSKGLGWTGTQGETSNHQTLQHVSLFEWEVTRRSISGPKDGLRVWMMEEKLAIKICRESSLVFKIRYNIKVKMNSYDFSQQIWDTVLVTMLCSL